MLGVLALLVREPGLQLYAMGALQRLEARQQRFQVLVDSGEQDRVIDVEIAVHDTVLNRGLGCPWKVRKVQLQRFRQMADRLAQDFIASYDGVAGFLVRQIDIERHAVGEAENRPAGHDHLV